MHPAIHLAPPTVSANPATQLSALPTDGAAVIGGAGFGRALAEHVGEVDELAPLSAVRAEAIPHPDLPATSAMQSAPRSRPMADLQGGKPMKEAGPTPDPFAKDHLLPSDGAKGKTNEVDAVKENRNEERIKGNSQQQHESDSILTALPVSVSPVVANSGALHPIELTNFSAYSPVPALSFAKDTSTAAIPVDSPLIVMVKHTAPRTSASDESKDETIDSQPMGFPDALGVMGKRADEPTTKIAPVAHYSVSIPATASSRATSPVTATGGEAGELSPGQTAQAGTLSLESANLAGLEQSSEGSYPNLVQSSTAYVQPSSNPISPSSNAVGSRPGNEMQGSHAGSPMAVAASPTGAIGTTLDSSHTADFDRSSVASGIAHAQHVAAGAVSLSVNPYQKLDQISGSPVSIMTGANRMTVGLHDPGLGWLEIRTQSTAGQVAAALVTTSSQTHQALADQLPVLAQFLSDREVRVNSLAVEQHAPGGYGAGHGNSGNEQGANSSQHRNGAQSELDDNLAVVAESGSESLVDARPVTYISVLA